MYRIKCWATLYSSLFQLRFWPVLVRARADVEYFMNIALGPPPPTKVLRPEPIPGSLIGIYFQVDHSLLEIINGQVLGPRNTG